VCFIILALAERAIDQRRDHGGLSSSFHYVAVYTDLHRLLALSIGVSLVFSVYFILSDIADYLGPGVLINLFFKFRDPLPPASQPLIKLRGAGR